MATVGASVDGVDATDPAALIGETGLLMAEENSVSGRAGCLTPATALGTAELRRFERAHLDFKISA